MDMQWTHQGNKITNMPEDVVGFVYLITNTTNGRMYIGKKLARFKRSRPPLKGRKNKRRYKVDPDWQDYYGSSDDLTIDVNKLGKDKFKREILLTSSEYNNIIFSSKIEIFVLSIFLDLKIHKILPSMFVLNTEPDLRPIIKESL